MDKTKLAQSIKTDMLEKSVSSLETLANINANIAKCDRLLAKMDKPKPKKAAPKGVDPKLKKEFIGIVSEFRQFYSWYKDKYQ